MGKDEIKGDKCHDISAIVNEGEKVLEALYDADKISNALINSLGDHARAAYMRYKAMVPCVSTSDEVDATRYAIAADVMNFYETSHKTSMSLEKVVLSMRKLDERSNELQDREREPEPLLYMDGTPIFSQGDISMIQGAAKARKTTAAVAMAHAVLTGDAVEMSSPFRCHLPEASVLFIDTEQSDKYAAKRMKQIGHAGERFHYIPMRDCSQIERLITAFTYIVQYQPTFCILDGIGDLSDTNDKKEFDVILDMLLRYSRLANTHICSITHTNGNTDKSRGHAGTNLTNKCETILWVRKTADDDDKSVIIGHATRGMKPASWTIATDADDNFLFEKVIDKVLTFEEVAHAVTSSMIDDHEYKSAELENIIMQATGTGERNAKGYISKLVENGVIRYRQSDADKRVKLYTKCDI